MSEQKYPTREWIVACKQDAERINKEDLGGYIYLYDVVLAMHDEIDAKQAEIDRLREYLRNVQGELLVMFDSHELPDMNLIEMVQRIDVFLSPTPDGAER